MSDDYTDLELAEMHAEGVPCPGDDDHAREYYALLDWLDEQCGHNATCSSAPHPVLPDTLRETDGGLGS